MSPLVSTGWPKKFPNRSEALPFSNRDIVTAISHCRHVPCGLIPSSQNFSNVDAVNAIYLFHLRGTNT